MFGVRSPGRQAVTGQEGRNTNLQNRRRLLIDVHINEFLWNVFIKDLHLPTSHHIPSCDWSPVV
jgi:hypothetical protein